MGWLDKAEAKRAECIAKIPVEWRLRQSYFNEMGASASSSTNLIALEAIDRSGVLDTNELHITSAYSVVELLDKLSTGVLSSSEVTTAFCKRAAVAGQLTSCLTETMFEEAQERASFLDKYLKTEGKLIGPLHGLPVSIKDHYRYKGSQTTLGLVSWLDHLVDTVNSPLVDLLLDLGAVIYVKTNMPQSGMTADSDNNVFGRTLNPHNTSLTAGGSSGGEGALIALRGSLLGMGSDLAGSVRIPALCCGIYSFKPTADRLPFHHDIATPVPSGLPFCVKPSAGPMATNVSDLELAMRVLLSRNPWTYDSTACSMPWLSRSLDKSTSLTIGILPEDPLYPLHPPVRRALSTAVHLLSRRGHKLIPLPHRPETSAHKACLVGWESFHIPAASTATINHISASGEPAIPSLLTQPKPVGWTTPRGSDIDGLAAIIRDKSAYAEAWRKLWAEFELDVVIGSGAQGTACKHDGFGQAPYTIVWNFLNYPASIIPFTKSSKVLDPEKMEVQLPAIGPDYEPELMDGAPCAIQVAAPMYQDEKCMAATRVIDEVLNGHDKA